MPYDVAVVGAGGVARAAGTGARPVELPDTAEAPAVVSEAPAQPAGAPEDAGKGGEPAGEDGDPLRATLLGDLRSDLAQGLARLSADQRSVVVLRDVDKMKKSVRTLLDRYLARPAHDTVLVLVAPSGAKSEATATV